jgi:hypothetical protein
MKASATVQLVNRPELKSELVFFSNNKNSSILHFKLV